MSAPQTSTSRKKVDPDLRDALDQAVREAMLQINCHAIGTIQSFDPAKQTVQATLNYPKSVLRSDGAGGYKPVLIDYPILLDVPVVILSGGPAALTFPIQKGDQCLILFNDRDIDNWFQSGQKVPLASSRLHSLSDAIALVGLRPSSNPLANYDATHAGFRWGDALLQLSESKIKLANATESLNTILQDLLSAIQLITVAGVTPGGGVSGVPVNAAAFAAIATRLGGLLE